ncbi:MAG: aminotransferase class I/II-fold pyridoxal phosphate-dependent enzyme [Solirubrobacteraceae bacterium]
MDHSRAPLLEALADYHRLDRYGFTPPAHRQGRGIDPRVLEVMGLDPFRDDVLVSSVGDASLQQAEELMANAVGAEHAFFSTCGSSLSVKAAMLAVAGHDGHLILSRDVHKSVVAGMIFSGLQPCWVRPRWDAKLHIAHPPSPESIAEAWERYPHAAGALIVSPTPYGTCADIEAIAEICHDHGKPLIVDEAWGAHLPFCEELPTWAMDAGADICVVSVHKTGAGFEQGSVFHVQGDRIDFPHLSACADLLMTTSPNVLLYAAIDGWRRQMVEQGSELLHTALQLADRLRSDIDRLAGLHVVRDELLGAEASNDLDRLQIMIDLSELGISGYQAADWLHEHERIDMHLSDHARIMATVSIADDETTTDRLRGALERLTGAAEDFPEPKPVKIPDPPALELETVNRPRDSFFSQFEDVKTEDAAGRIAAEQITPYPPGIPVILPGERINQAVIDYLLSGLEAGMTLPDPADPSLKTIRVMQ